MRSGLIIKVIIDISLYTIKYKFQEKLICIKLYYFIQISYKIINKNYGAPFNSLSFTWIDKEKKRLKISKKEWIFSFGENKP